MTLFMHAYEGYGAGGPLSAWDHLEARAQRPIPRGEQNKGTPGVYKATRGLYIFIGEGVRVTQWSYKARRAGPPRTEEL